MAIREELEAIITVQDNASKTLEKIQKKLDELSNKSKNPIKNIGDSSGKAKKGIDGASTAVAGLAGALGGLAGVLTVSAVMKAINTIAEFGKSCVNSASDVEELKNVTEQVFEGITDEVESFSKYMASAMGRSTYDMTKYISEMGAVIKGLGGFNTSQIKEMSEQLGVLAVDIASFSNIDDEQAFNALRGGIVGETESLKRLGIVINDTVMAQYALSKGYKDSWQNMDASTKTMLRYQAIMEKTSFMQGDAIRTIGSYANQVKSLKGNYENLQAVIGEKLKGKVTPAVSGISKLIESLSERLSRKTESDFLKEYTEELINIRKLQSEYKALGEQSIKTTGDKQRMLAIVTQLKAQYPELLANINEEKVTYNELANAIDDVISKLKEKTKVSVEDYYLSKQAGYNKQILEQMDTAVQKSTEKIAKLSEEYKKFGYDINNFADISKLQQWAFEGNDRAINDMFAKYRKKLKEEGLGEHEIRGSQQEILNAIMPSTKQAQLEISKITEQAKLLPQLMQTTKNNLSSVMDIMNQSISGLAEVQAKESLKTQQKVKQTEIELAKKTSEAVTTITNSTENTKTSIIDKNITLTADEIAHIIAVGGIVERFVNGVNTTYKKLANGQIQKTETKTVIPDEEHYRRYGGNLTTQVISKNIIDQKTLLEELKTNYKKTKNDLTLNTNGGNGKDKDKKGGSKEKNKWEQLLESLAKTEAELNLTPTSKQASQIKELSAKIRAKQDELTAWLLSVGELTRSQALDENIKHLEDELKNAVETKDSAKVKELREKIKSLQVEKIIPAIIDNIDKQLDEEINKLKAEDIGANKEDLSKLQSKIDEFRASKLKQIESQKNSGLITQDEYIKNNTDMLNKLYEWYKSIGDIDNTIKTRAEQNKQNIKQLLINQEQQEVLQSLQNVVNSTSEEEIRTNYQNLVKTTRDNILNEVSRQFNALNDSNKAEILTPSEIMKMTDNDFKAYADKIKNTGNTSLISLIEALELLKDKSEELKKLNKPTTFEIANKSLKLMSDGFKALAKGTDSLTSQALNDIAGLIDSTINIAKELKDGISQIKAGNLFTGISGIAGAVIGIIGSIASIFKPDEGKAKAEQEYKKALDSWSKTLSDSNKHLRDSIDNLKNEVSNFQKTLIKNMASNTSTKNLTMNENIAKELALMYANSFDATIKTTVSRTKESYSWLGIKRDTQYLGTETKEESLRKIMNMPNFKNADEILSWYEKHKNDSYSATFENLGSRHGLFTGYTHIDKIVGSNFKDSISMIPVFANNVKQIMELNKNIKQYGVLESFEGVNVTSIGEQKEQLRNILKKLVESSGQDYFKVANSIEEKLNELIKEDDVLVTAFDDVRSNFTSNLAKGNSVIDSLANGLQGYFDKLRANIAKVKYDLEFRDLGDFEKEFTEKFDKISKSLAKLRLENGKTLKDLDPKELDFNDLFKKLTTIDKTASDMRAVVQELRNQAKSQGLSDEIIDQMLPLDKVTGKAQEIANALKNAMTSALNTNSFEQFSMTLGDSLYTIVRDNLVQAFADSAKYKELFEKYTKTAEYEAELSKVSTIRQAYDVIQSQLKRTENMLKAEGLDFRSTIASNGEYNGGFMNRETIRPSSMLESGGININTTVNIDNKGFLAIDDLTNTLTDTIKEKIAISKEREV